jgi:hypothetical protein
LACVDRHLNRAGLLVDGHEVILPVTVQIADNHGDGEIRSDVPQGFLDGGR